MKNQKISKMKSSRLILVLLLLANTLMAQQFKKTAKLSGIKTDGLHAIAISPQIRSFSNVDLSDVRLFGADNNEVPYYILKNARNTTSSNFEEYPIISKEIKPQKASIIIIENTGGNLLDQIVLNIANSNLLKICDISGSNNQKEWFGLLDKYQLSGLENPTSTSIFVNINLPKSNYHYLKFQFQDSTTAPINVLKIGNFKQASVSQQLLYLKADFIKHSTNTEQKRTQINLRFNQPQIIENIVFKVAKPNFYNRKARILANRTLLKKHNKKEHYQETLAQFELNSNRDNNFELPQLFEKEITIEIDNQDNPALEITSIDLAQLPVYLVADLKTNQNYTLKTGDATLSAPSYDLANNANSNLPTASFSELNTIENQHSTQNTNTSFWQNKYFLWFCIAAAGLVTFYFSASLLKDMKQ